ncbi:TonB-dependent receptor [Permianibacter sp. IMCC34836]|uniref:TonB-dependent receptor plug domain-containing protein n=1 Tax=Permianibacter fluminis TaxID=2738515 RepID=UPI0015582507|nr:TonB-dependent receptor [Permianibacter fluminis]NQD38492.1 TonB-dependent receptor [Permianibacter fluminis]
MALLTLLAGVATAADRAAIDETDRTTDSVAEQKTKLADEADLFALDLEALSNIHVTVASARGETLRETPVLVSRLDASEARQYGLQTLAEWLSILPGVIVQDTAIGTEAVMMRGLVEGFNQKVLFLLDGVPYWQPTHGDIPLPAIPLSLISHIEVIRGPGGVIYGTNATAGVINVVTRRDDKRDAELTGGSQHSWRGESYQHYSLTDDSDLTLAVASSNGPDYDGEFTNRPLPGSFPQDTPRDGAVPRHKEQQSAFFRYRYHELNVHWHGFESDSEGLAAAASLLNRSTLEYQGQQLSTDYRFDLGDAHRLQLFADGTQYTLRIPTDNLFAGVTDGLQTFADDGEGNTRTRLGARWQWTVGPEQYLQAGIVREQRRSDEYQLFNRSTGSLAAIQMPADKTTELAGYGQWDARFGDWRTVLGARRVDSDQFDAEWLPRFSIGWNVSTEQNWRLVYSEGYNAPTFLQLNVAIPPNAIRGNPDLRAERIKNLELAWSWQQGPQSLTLTGYHLDIDDAIRRQLIPNSTTITFVNVAPFTRNGVEAEWRWRQARWQWYGSASWQREGNSDDDGFALLTPKYQFSLGGQYRRNNHLLGGSLRYIGARAAADVVSLLALHYQYEQPHWQLAFGLGNLLADDQQHADVQDQVPSRLVPGGPDEASAALRYTLRF